jgi:hypothetical protein
MLSWTPRSDGAPLPGIERHLVGRAIHHGRIGPEDLLGAVAVVDVEIHHRGPRDAVALLHVAGDDGGGVEEAEPHRADGLGMVPGRAHGAEAVRRTAGDHLVGRHHDAADRAQHRLEGARRHRGVGVEPHQPLLRRGVADFRDVVDRVAQRDRLQRRRGRLHAHEVLETRVFQGLVNGAQPVRPLGMSGRRDVVEAGRVGDEKGRHGRR